MFIVCMVKPSLPPFLLAFMPRTNAATRGGAPALRVPRPPAPLLCWRRRVSQGLLLAELETAPAPRVGPPSHRVLSRPALYEPVLRLALLVTGSLLLVPPLACQLSLAPAGGPQESFASPPEECFLFFR